MYEYQALISGSEVMAGFHARGERADQPGPGDRSRAFVHPLADGYGIGAARDWPATWPAAERRPDWLRVLPVTQVAVATDRSRAAEERACTVLALAHPGGRPAVHRVPPGHPSGASAGGRSRGTRVPPAPRSHSAESRPRAAGGTMALTG